MMLAKFDSSSSTVLKSTGAPASFHDASHGQGQCEQHHAQNQDRAADADLDVRFVAEEKAVYLHAEHHADDAASDSQGDGTPQQLAQIAAHVGGRGGGDD